VRREWAWGLLLSATATATAAAAEPAGERPDPSRLRYCSLTRLCGLPAPAEWCPDRLSHGVPGVTYGEERCREARALHGRGVGTDDALGYRIYHFLGARYQVAYAVEGEVRLSPARLAFLVNDLPLAAKLLSRFQRTRYTAEYLDGSGRRFRGTRGGKLSGEVELISGGTDEGRLYYFGRGASQVAFWKLRGVSLMVFEYTPAPDGRALRYRLRVLTTPASAALNVIMKTGLFRRVVEGEIREVVADVTEASRKLEQGGLPAPGPAPEFTGGERAKLEAFLKLP
jgi:hypothetical protein